MDFDFNGTPFILTPNSDKTHYQGERMTPNLPTPLSKKVTVEWHDRSKTLDITTPISTLEIKEGGRGVPHMSRKSAFTLNDKTLEGTDGIAPDGVVGGVLDPGREAEFGPKAFQHGDRRFWGPHRVTLPQGGGVLKDRVDGNTVISDHGNKAAISLYEEPNLYATQSAFTVMREAHLNPFNVPDFLNSMSHRDAILRERAKENQPDGQLVSV